MPEPYDDATARASATVTALHEALVDHDLGPFLATPCGILAPLLGRLADDPRADYRVVTREDNAVGIAAGHALAGRPTTVLMQNSGFGLCVNALASLVVPYALPMLLVVSLRGTGVDDTPENAGMGALTAPTLAGLGVRHEMLDAEHVPEQMARLARVVREERRPAALLVAPEQLGWRP